MRRNLGHMREYEVRRYDRDTHLWITVETCETEAEGREYVRLAAAGRYRVCMFSGRIIHEVTNG